MEDRLQKLIAEAGICSRRSAEKLIEAGRVKVNGQTAALGNRADPAHDAITVDGAALPQSEKKVYLLLNKPRGYVTTLSDEQGRPTVAELVRNAGARVFPVGRLDIQSEGLLVMTNDGDLMQRLIHPKFEVSKTYWLKVGGAVRNAETRLARVKELEGEPLCPAETELLRRTGQTAELLITIHEGKNRQIRRMCEVCGLTVLRLRRVREHTLELGSLKPGEWRPLTAEELRALGK